jgi:NADPH2:quinone reductase
VKGVALFIQGLSAALILKHAGRLAAGDDVFIEGAAGGLGLLATQLARLYGARTVFAGASTDQKRALTKDRGAHHAIDYSLPGWSKEIMEQTSGRGVDLVLEMTGGAVFEEAFGALAPQARVVAYGVASRKPFQIPSQRLIARGYSVIGFYLGLYLDRSELIGSTLAELADLVRRGDLKVDIGGTFPLSEATAMHQQLEGRGSAGKLVIIP